MQFLNSLFKESCDLEYLLKTLAYSLNGDKYLQQFFMWNGAGGNGKGKMIELLRRVYGDYMMTLPVSYFTKPSEGKGQSLPELANTRAARFVYTSEPDSNGKEQLQSSFIKLLSGGDELCVRKLYSEPFTFVPQFSTTILCNDTRINKVDLAIQRRLRVLPFPFQFKMSEYFNPENPTHRLADLTLDFTLKDDSVRDSMLLLLLNYYSKYIHGNKEIPMSKNVAEATKGYFNDNNPIAAWLQQNYNTNATDTDRLTASQLSEDFNLTNGEQLNPRMVGIYMRALGFEPKKSHGTLTFHRIKKLEPSSKIV
jgi:putative DNA primase/helicase